MNFWVLKGESHLRQIVLMPSDPWATNPTEHRGGGGGGRVFHVNVGGVYSLILETKSKPLFETQKVLASVVQTLDSTIHRINHYLAGPGCSNVR